MPVVIVITYGSCDEQRRWQMMTTRLLNTTSTLEPGNTIRQYLLVSTLQLGYILVAFLIFDDIFLELKKNVAIPYIKVWWYFQK
jgi:hypothetical protein